MLLDPARLQNKNGTYSIKLLTSLTLSVRSGNKHESVSHVPPNRERMLVTAAFMPSKDNKYIKLHFKGKYRVQTQEKGMPASSARYYERSYFILVPITETYSSFCLPPYFNILPIMKVSRHFLIQMVENPTTIWGLGLPSIETFQGIEMNKVVITLHKSRTSSDPLLKDCLEIN